jgi:hypothetical protein
VNLDQGLTRKTGRSIAGRNYSDYFHEQVLLIL